MILVFTDSAFRHGATIEDIDCIMSVPLVDRLMEGYTNKLLVLI